MKNRILIWLLATSMVHQTNTYNPLFLATCVAPMSVVIGKTVWDYITEDTEKNARNRFVRVPFFKNILKKAIHNIVYIGLPIGVVAGTLCYVSCYQAAQQQNRLLGKDLKQMIFNLLPRVVVQMDSEQNLELKGVQELTDSFIKKYSSSVKTATKTVLVKTTKGIFYVAQEVADILKAALHELKA